MSSGSVLNIAKAELPIVRLFRKYSRRLRFRRQLDRSLRPVFIYQMGKVGSTSLYDSLTAQYHESVLHGHGFSRKFHNWRIRLLHSVFSQGKPLDIITLTREPVSRNISHFFQDFQHYTGKRLEEFNRLSVTEVRDLFLRHYDHELATHWFDHHIKRKFDIDIYARPMPDCGYQVYEANNVRLLLIKVELDNAVKEEAIKAFLGLEQFTITNSNVGKKKAYGDLYLSFINQVRLPAAYIEAMLATKYFNHFYDAETAAAVWHRWHGKE